MSFELTTPSEVIPAATVLVFRHGAADDPPEILMVQRAKEMRFAGGAAVFPGGRVDPGDHDLAARIAPNTDPLVGAARIAGIRETLEETGLAIATRNRISAQEAASARELLLQTGSLEPVLDTFGWELDLDQLTPFAHWCPNHTRAFDTRFFITNLGTGAVDIAVDATENTRLFWASGPEALRLADAGEISVIYPTRCNLERVAQFAHFGEVLEDARRHPVDVITPFKAVQNGEEWLMIPDGLGYPSLGKPLATLRRG
jgi:8-oxo-dGTP pyrophosphatase MutT (NUDIX family)